MYKKILNHFNRNVLKCIHSFASASKHSVTDEQLSFYYNISNLFFEQESNKKALEELDDALSLANYYFIDFLPVTVHR